MMELTLYHFFPEKLNLYGDKGNVIALQKRCEWRGINLTIQEVKDVKKHKLSKADLLFIGGGSDREQSLCTEQLFLIKDDFKKAIEDGVSALTICGGYQFLGTHYITPDKQELKGLGILDFYTESGPERLIGNVLLESEKFGKIVGYENHGGRTYHGYQSLGDVVVGSGNNGKDEKEGLVYKNLIGTYLHGPILPKNPNISDFLIEKAVERKYGEAKLKELEDSLEGQTNDHVWNMYK